MMALAGGGRTGANRITYPGLSGVYENGDPIVFVEEDGTSHTGTMPDIDIVQEVPAVPILTNTTAAVTVGSDRQTYAFDWQAAATDPSQTPNAFDIYQMSVTTPTGNGVVNLANQSGTLSALTHGLSITPNQALGKTGSVHTVTAQVKIENTSLESGTVGRTVITSQSFSITVAPNIFTYSGTTIPPGHDTIIAGNAVTPFADINFELAADEEFNPGDEIFVRIKLPNPDNTAFAGLMGATPAWTIVTVGDDVFLQSPAATDASSLVALRDQIRSAQLSTGTGEDGIYYGAVGPQSALDFEMHLWRNEETTPFSPALFGKSAVVDVPHSLSSSDVAAPTASAVPVIAGDAASSANVMAGLAVSIPEAKRNPHNAYTIVVTAIEDTTYPKLVDDGWSGFSLADGRLAYIKTVTGSPDSLVSSILSNGSLSVGSSIAASRPDSPYLMDAGTIAFYETVPGQEPVVANIADGTSVPLFTINAGSFSAKVDIAPSAPTTPAVALAISSGTEVSGTQPWAFCTVDTANSHDRFWCRIAKNPLLTYSNLGAFVDTGEYLEMTTQLTPAQLNAALAGLTVQVTDPFYTAPGTHDLAAGDVEIFRNAEATAAITRSAQNMAVTVNAIPASFNATIAADINNRNGSVVGKPVFSGVEIGSHPDDLHTIEVTVAGGYNGTAEFSGGTYLPPATWQFAASSQAAAKAWLEQFQLLPTPNICDPDGSNCQLVTVTASVAASDGVKAEISQELRIHEFNDATTVTVRESYVGTRATSVSAQEAMAFDGSDLDSMHQKFLVELHLDESDGAEPYNCNPLFPGSTIVICKGGSNGAMTVTTASGAGQFSLDASTRQKVDGAIWDNVVYRIDTPVTIAEVTTALSLMTFNWVDDGGAHIGQQVPGYLIFKDRITGEELARSNTWTPVNSEVVLGRRLRGSPALSFAAAEMADPILIADKEIYGVAKSDMTALQAMFALKDNMLSRLSDDLYEIYNSHQQKILSIDVKGSKMHFHFEPSWSIDRLHRVAMTGKGDVSYRQALLMGAGSVGSPTGDNTATASL